MIPMMVEVLLETGTDESAEQLTQAVEEFVMRLNGRQTIYQMIQLCEEVRRRGGEPLEALQYKHRYHDLLWQQVGQRIAAIESGSVNADEMTVPGSRELLRELTDFGLALYLASGTDLHYVKREAELLGLDQFFGTRIYGALDDYKKFSKQMIIRQMIEESHVQGSSIVGFGDGFVEIEEVKKSAASRLVLLVTKSRDRELTIGSVSALSARVRILFSAIIASAPPYTKF